MSKPSTKFAVVTADVRHNLCGQIWDPQLNWRGSIMLPSFMLAHSNILATQSSHSYPSALFWSPPYLSPLAFLRASSCKKEGDVLWQEMRWLRKMGRPVAQPHITLSDMAVSSTGTQFFVLRNVVTFHAPKTRFEKYKGWKSNFG